MQKDLHESVGQTVQTTVPLPSVRLDQGHVELLCLARCQMEAFGYRLRSRLSQGYN
jgi:hypothetical protein